MVNEDSRRLHEDRHQRYGTLPFVHTSYVSQLSIEYDGSRYVTEIFRDNNRCAHVDFERWLLHASGCV